MTESYNIIVKNSSGILYDAWTEDWNAATKEAFEAAERCNRLGIGYKTIEVFSVRNDGNDNISTTREYVYNR